MTTRCTVMRIEGAGVVIERLTIEAGVADRSASIRQAPACSSVASTRASRTASFATTTPWAAGGYRTSTAPPRSWSARASKETPRATGGGAVDNVQSSPRFVDCDFVDNAATRASGGGEAVNNIQEAAANLLAQVSIRRQLGVSRGRNAHRRG